MKKYNYFDSLFSLARYTEESVKSLFSDKDTSYDEYSAESKKSISQILSEIESALFSDFFPPLERADIARLSHALARISFFASSMPCFNQKKFEKEKEISLELAKLISATTEELRAIKKIDSLPQLKKLRLEFEHYKKKITPSEFNRRSTENIMAGLIIFELLSALDLLIEIILNNV